VFIRVGNSETCLRASGNPVQGRTFNSMSGRAMLGSIALMVVFSQVGDSGSLAVPSLPTDR